MTCEEGMELIQRSIDSDLDSQETMLMNEHIQTCPDCAALLDRLTLLSRNLAELPKVSPPFSLVDSILPRLDQIDAERQAEQQAEQAMSVVPALTAEAKPSPSRSRNRSTLRKLSAAIAAGLVAGLVIVAAPSVFNSSSGDKDSASSLAISSTSTSNESAADSSEAAPRFDENSPAAKSIAGATEEPQLMDKVAEPNKLSVQFSERIAPGESASPSSGTAASGAASNATGSMTSKAGDSSDSPTDRSESPSTAPAETAKSFASQENADVSPSPDQEAASGALGNQEPEVAGMYVVPASAAPTWISPDQKLKAVAEEKKVSVYSNEDNALIFQIAIPEGSTLSDVYWEQDSSVMHYSWKDKDGIVAEMTWDASSNNESAPSESSK